MGTILGSEQPDSGATLWLEVSAFPQIGFVLWVRAAFDVGRNAVHTES
jgi:hypothetical protein